jgi:outer membrane lipoprotein-sorting protein
LRASGAFFCLSGLLGMALGAEPVETVLSRMDKEARSFVQMTAKFKNTTYTKVLDDTSAEAGSIWLKRSGGKIEMRGEIAGEDARSFGLRGSEGQVYYPKLKTVQIYDLGEERGLVDQFLLLGFGSSGKELAQNYTVKVGGEEPVGGRKTTRLELVPKDKKMQEKIVRIDLWIPWDAGYPVQQKFVKPRGNYNLVLYWDVNVKPGLPDSEFRLALPPGTKRERPQKQGG